MTRFLALALLSVTSAAAACEPGGYRAPDGAAAAGIVQRGDILRYTFVDGRRGTVGEAGGLLVCRDGKLRGTDGTAWAKLPTTVTPTKFTSHGKTLSGMLIEPAGAAPSPLVVLVHGSERTPASANGYTYVLAAQGLRVFAYDKRGTGGSEGEYTQNFELLADDAAAAFAEAKKLAGPRANRIGYFGGSQGGWVAPLAATRTAPDFVAVGFGLMLSPVEEDREQVLSELREAGASAETLAAAREVSEATAALVRSHFEGGYARLAAVKARHGGADWFKRIKGEYTGAILAMPEAELRRVGRALFDELELIWDYDAAATLAKVRAPQLWIVAEADREAPPGVTLDRLSTARKTGARIDIRSFPDTDHSMVEFTESPDGSRTYGRITDGYFRLLADWIAGRSGGPYGRARQR